MLIAFPRSLARRFRAVLRQCTTSATAFRAAVVTIRASRDGLALEAVLDEAGLRLDHPGHFPDAEVRIPVSALSSFEGRADTTVTLEETEPTRAQVSWTEGGTTAQSEVSLLPANENQRFPQLPAEMKPVGNGFVRALRDASQTVGKQAGNRALHRVQLLGGKGVVAGTDGRQLLLQRGFSFPWKDALLVPALPAWGNRELPEGEAALVGLRDTHVFVRLGPWTFALSLDSHGRYPPVESIVPHPRSITGRVRFGEGDVDHLLAEETARDDSPYPIILEAGKSVLVRPRHEDGTVGEPVPLPSSALSGKPVSLVTERRYLHRALRLGFREVEVVKPSVPVCCRDSQRVYVWMPLSEPNRSANSTGVPTVPKTITRKENVPMADTNGRHGPPLDGEGPPSTPDPLAEAEAIRGLLGEAQSRLARLIGSLKQFRKQSRAVRAAVLSIRDLPPLTP